ncbi:MAG TPA: hypothetical protein VJY35_08445 [Candidatus Eisenbacteria bacterium]|nr:hypothetical protein [Candidatus Eisenbacteria bacterium]
MRIRYRLAAPLGLALLLAGCSVRDTLFGPGVLGTDQAYIVTTDFTTGALSVIDLDTRAVTPNVAPIHSDATLRTYNGLIYVLNRFGQDNVQIIDPLDNFATRRQFSTGNGSNPQDIAFLSPVKAYVSRYGSADLLIIDPRDGAQRGVISLAGLADGDGLPEMAQMTLVGPYLYVACQRLTNFFAANPSVIAIIDTRTDRLVDAVPLTPGVQGIPLAGRNPFSDLVYDAAANELLVACAGDFGVTDGGIERINVSTRQSLGFAVTEAAVAGDIVDLAWNTAAHSYAVVSDAGFNTSLIAWNTAGAVLDTVYAPGGFSIADVAVNNRAEVYVCDSQLATPGVRVFRAVADTLLAGPIVTGLPPNQVAFR